MAYEIDYYVCLSGDYVSTTTYPIRLLPPSFLIPSFTLSFCHVIDHSSFLHSLSSLSFILSLSAFFSFLLNHLISSFLFYHILLSFFLHNLIPSFLLHLFHNGNPSTLSFFLPLFIVHFTFIFLFRFN